MSNNQHDYRAALRAKGVKPIPEDFHLRTAKRDGDIELLPAGRIGHWQGGVCTVRTAGES